MARLFGTSGIRAIADKPLILLAFDVGLAVGGRYKHVVVAADTRTSGEAVKCAVISGLLAGGADVTDIGIAPTPTLAYAARDHSAGVMITASHNPPEYNGIKLWNPDGSAFDLEQQKQIEDIIAAGSLCTAPWTEMKQIRTSGKAIDSHIDRILSDYPEKLKTNVVVDCGCGAASLVTPNLLTKMGCAVTAVDCYPSGYFPRDVEPVGQNLGKLSKIVRETGADVGIAHDGDADRMMAVDDKGRFIPGDKLLVILARSLKAGEAVTTVDASMTMEDAGFKVRRTKVGDSYVSGELKTGGGDFGGEPSGAWIFPRVSFCPDGIYAAAVIAAIAGAQKISALADEIRAYPILRGSTGSDGIRLTDLRALLPELKPLAVNETDGIRLNFNDGWVLVRPSGTEPKIRLTAEARTEARVRQLYDDCRGLIQGLMEKKH